MTTPLPRLSPAQDKLLILFGQSHWNGGVSAGPYHACTVRVLIEEGMLAVTYRDHNNQPTTFEAWVRAWTPKDTERRNFKLTAKAEAYLAQIGHPMKPVPAHREADRA